MERSAGGRYIVIDVAYFCKRLKTHLFRQSHTDIKTLRIRHFSTDMMQAEHKIILILSRAPVYTS